jgi:GNAT superfamily N-acetyltransferase
MLEGDILYKRLKFLYESCIEELYSDDTPMDVDDDIEAYNEEKYKKVEDIGSDIRLGYKTFTNYYGFVDIIMGDKVIGSFDYSIADIEGKGRVIIMGFILLHKEYRGKGIGRRIYDYLIDSHYGLVSGASLSKDSIAVWERFIRDGKRVYYINMDEFSDGKLVGKKVVSGGITKLVSKGELSRRLLVKKR